MRVHPSLRLATMQTVSMLVAALVGIVGLVAAQAPELNVITTFPDNPFSRM